MNYDDVVTELGKNHHRVDFVLNVVMDDQLLLYCVFDLLNYLHISSIYAKKVCALFDLSHSGNRIS